MKVVIATTNPGKLKEFAQLKGDCPWLELELAPPGFNPEETGTTFIENAKIKARAAAASTGLTAIADDSGLIIEALNGRPGIRSARYCEGSDADRRAKVLAELKDVADDRRQAAFMCAMAVCEPDGTISFTSIRAWEGYIGRTEKGVNGFGYDSIFYLNNTTTTSAELAPEEKNRISHRGQAFRHVLTFLKQKQLLLEKA
jgi:XTP/dITP diphosphohydrolase